MLCGRHRILRPLIWTSGLRCSDTSANARCWPRMNRQDQTWISGLPLRGCTTSRKPLLGNGDRGHEKESGKRGMARDHGSSELSHLLTVTKHASKHADTVVSCCTAAGQPGATEHRSLLHRDAGQRWKRGGRTANNVACCNVVFLNNIIVVRY